MTDCIHNKETTRKTVNETRTDHKAEQKRSHRSVKITHTTVNTTHKNINRAHLHVNGKYTNG